MGQIDKLNVRCNMWGKLEDNTNSVRCDECLLDKMPLCNYVKCGDKLIDGIKKLFEDLEKIGVIHQYGEGYEED